MLARMRIFEAPAHLFHPRHSNNHRPRILHPEGFFVLLVLAIVFRFSLLGFSVLSRSSGNILGFSSTITPDKVVTLTNVERAKAGVGQLQVSNLLTEAASEKARDMFTDQYWAHYSPSGKTPWDFMKNVGYRYTIAGENLARDFLEPEDMVNAWMNSPSHRENIVNPRYSEIGIAVVDGVLNGVETTLVVQMFGNPTVAVIPPGQVSPEAQSPIPVATIAPTPASLAEVTAAESSVNQAINDRAVVAAAETQPPLSTIAPELFRDSVEYLQGADYPQLFSPLHLSKAVFLAMTMLVISVLIYDSFVMGQLNSVRMVGKNLAHIALFFTILFLVIFFKGGVIGG